LNTILAGRTRAINVWFVFLFVAAWHDLEPRLLHWGLIMPAALVPEMVSFVTCLEVCSVGGCIL
jgi:hypothetical protein